MADLGLLFPTTVVGERNFEGPVVASEEWRAAGQDDGFSVGVETTHTMVELTPENGGFGLLHRHFLGDYYYRIYFIPEVLTVRNPIAFRPVQFFIWNAFFEENQILNRADSGADGVENIADAGANFGALEVRPFDIYITDDAPVTISAAFDYEFILGGGIFRFETRRIAVILDRPEMPVEHAVDYKTDVLRSWDGTEQRISVISAPRQTFDLQFFLDSETKIRSRRADLFLGLGSEAAIPLWHEPANLNTATGTSDTVLQVDGALADFKDDEFVLVEDSTGNTALARVVSSDDTSITIDNPIGAEFPKNSSVYPVIRVMRMDGARVGQQPVNAGLISWEGKVVTLEPFGGRGGVLHTYKDQPVLELVPLNNDMVSDVFGRNQEVFDYGAKFRVYSAEEIARLAGERTFWLETYQQRQDFKVFLDAVVGMREPFFLPSFREDLFLVSQPDSGSEILRVRTDEEVGDDYYAFYFDSLAHRHLRCVTQAGIIYLTVTEVERETDGSLTLHLETALPVDAGANVISSISFMRVARLASDRVNFKHFMLDSEVTISVTTVEEEIG